MEEAGIKTEIPLMPEPWKPDYEKFKKEFEKCDINEDMVLVGHSCGTAFLVKWLGDTKKKVAKLILVAPWKIPQAKKQGRDIDFYGYEIDESIRERVGDIVIFTADDEDSDGKKSADIFNKALGGKVIELEDHGHYTLGDMGTKEFPELTEEILK